MSPAGHDDVLPSHEKFRTDVEVGCEFADVRQGQVPVAAENHRAQVPAAIEKPGKVGCGHLRFGEQVLQTDAHADPGPPDVLSIMVLHERAKEIEIVALVRRKIILPEHHRVRDFGNVGVLRGIVDRLRHQQGAESGVLFGQVSEVDFGMGGHGTNRLSRTSIRRVVEGRCKPETHPNFSGQFLTKFLRKRAFLR